MLTFSLSSTCSVALNELILKVARSNPAYFNDPTLYLRCLIILFTCTSVISVVPLCFVIVSLSSRFISVSQEGCASCLWLFLDTFIYILNVDIPQ